MSSRRSLQMVHLRVELPVAGVAAASGPAGAAGTTWAFGSVLASVGVAVVELTCRDPDERRPLEEPAVTDKILGYEQKVIRNVLIFLILLFYALASVHLEFT